MKTALVAQGLPTVIELTDELRDRYAFHALDRYAAYLEDLRARRLPGETKQIELAVSWAVEGEPDRALAELTSISADQWSPERRVALLRLKGALNRELGDAVQARSSYETALRCVQSEMEGAQSQLWLTQALKFDLVNLSDMPGFQFELLKEAQAIDVWGGNSAYMEALAGADFSSASFDTAFESEGGFSFGSTPTEVAGLNLALLIAYLTGDESLAREARTYFARQLAVQSRSVNSATGLEVATQEFIRARNSADLKKLLSRAGYLVQARISIDRLALELRPLKSEGRAADEVFRTALSFIGAMGSYLSDSARSRLTDELVKEAEAFLEGSSTPFVATGGRTASEFIDVMSAEANLSATHVSTLLDHLQSQVALRPWSFWSVLAAHEWGHGDIEAARRAIRTLTSLEATPDGLPIAMEVLRSISDDLPELDAEIDPWMLRQADEFQDIWTYFLSHRHEQATSRIGAWTEQLTKKVLTDLANPASVFPLQPHDRGLIFALPASYRYYSSEISEEHRRSQTRDILDAALRRKLYPKKKAGAFSALALMVPHIGDPSELRGQLEEHLPWEAEAAQPRHSLETGEDVRLVRIRLIELRAAVGLSVADREISELVISITSNNDELVESACAVVAKLATDMTGSEVLSAMLSRLRDTSLRVRASAAVGLLGSGALSSTPLGRAALDRISELATTDHPFVVQSILSAVHQRASQIPNEKRGQVKQLAGVLAHASHRDIRRWARRVLDAVPNMDLFAIRNRNSGPV